jgi:hypothetical protein
MWSNLEIWKFDDENSFIMLPVGWHFYLGIIQLVAVQNNHNIFIKEIDEGSKRLLTTAGMHFNFLKMTYLALVPANKI